MHEELTASTMPMELQTNAEVALTLQPTFIVGIGASAGGLEALERFFERMPVETGMAFVVVQHLSPDFRSLTDELLARRTKIRIHRVEDGMPVERDAMYLMPPKKDMIIANGRLLLTDKDLTQGMTLPIDHFFRSLAQDAGDRGIAVVLSGTGSDGSRGIRDIHEAGGLVLVQAEETAKFDGMPKSALKTGVVDAALAPEEMYATLLKYIKHPLCPEPAPALPPVPENAMDMVFRLLRQAGDIDFSCYKPTTVMRRIERRLLMAGSHDLDDYVRQLSGNPVELNALYKDLLIGVTKFFRDAPAFATLERNLLAQMLERLPRNDEFRVWVAGCATGEEAYSLGILIQEQIELLNKPINTKIFATDVHGGSLETASTGAYDEASLADVPPARLRRFFVAKGDRFHVSPELRKIVVFAHHNVIKDAPFTKLDLISCRNLLIYFQPHAQKKVLSLFHFGLKPHGILLLGPSESPGELNDEFDVVDSHWRIYRKRRNVRLASAISLAPALERPRASSLPLSPSANATASAHIDHPLHGVYDVLLDEFLPPSILVSEDRHVLQTMAGGGRYLQHRDGLFSADILDMVDPNLRLALTGALQRLFRESKPVTYKSLRVTRDDGECLVHLIVRPVQNRRSHVNLALICLEQVNKSDLATFTPQEIDLEQANSEHLLSLEAELRYTKENLQATIEELETSNEELQATNEELVASNEELQSTNEELHSVNEELYTVNGEYHRKINELTVLTADMDNLLASTELYLIFLDRNMAIRKFTPSIAESFNLLPQDVGRRIDSFTHSIEHPTLKEDLQHVLTTENMVERQVRDRRGKHYLLRVLPYRAPGSVDGVVLTMVDITTLKETQAEVHRKDQYLTAILRNSPNALYVMDLAGHYIVVDDSFRRLASQDPLGKTPRELFPAEAANRIMDQIQKVAREGKPVQCEANFIVQGEARDFLTVKFPLRDDEGQVIAVGGTKTDVTQLKAAEAKALEAVKQRELFLAMMSHELRNPLAAIRGAVRLMDRAGIDSASAREALAVINRRSQHMARLLDDLLDVARITQNRIEMKREVCDLAQLAHDVTEEVRATFQDRGITLTIQPPHAPMLVDGDWHRLQQLQVNLLLNGAKFTPPGGRVWYTLGREGDEAVIRVRDTGVGIPPAMLEKVFDLFVQMENRLDRSGGGIGVGLSLVRSIAEKHGGRVRAYSDGVDKGSEFVVWLPLSAQRVPDHANAALVARPASPSGARVLIVEDDPDIRSFTESLLLMDGFDVLAVADGSAALELLPEFRPQVALVDIGLPNMDGYELARRVRAFYNTRPLLLVAVTGYGQAQDQQAAHSAGFDYHLTKPIREQDLLRILDELPPPD